MNTTPLCPSCGQLLAPNSPKGLCPECLLKGAFPTGTESAGNPPRFVPPTIEALAAKFPQLEILELIGQGGMGAVYKTRQKQLDRLVALKILPPQAASGPGFAARFTREARALAKLNHPHIVTLYEFGQADGLFYFLMEFVDGLNLQQLLAGGRLAPNEAVAIVPQICDALQFAHQRGIVHRDIKPGNILLSKEGQVKIADFGVAKIIADGLTETAAGKKAPLPSEELTEAGCVLGTPQYMAPEQVAHPLTVDHRADIYSLGVVFYQMLTGELPAGKFEPPSKKVVVDVRLDEVVLRALEKRPELRYQQAGELRTQVETIAATGGPGAAMGFMPGTPVDAKMAVELFRARCKAGVWGLGLAAACVLMGINITPPQYGWTIGLWGVLLFVISAPLAWRAGEDLNRFKLATRLVLIDGMVTAAAGIWCAWNTSMLDKAWFGAIVVGCLGGIGYCLSCWARTNRLPSEPPNAGGWTNAKLALVTGGVLILTAGAAAVLARQYSLTPADEAAWTLDTRILARVAPVAALRPSRGDTSGISSTDTRIVARGVSLGALVAYAYGPPKFYMHWSTNRVILGPGVVDGKFDFLLTVSDHPQLALQAVIKKQLGLTAHRELQEADAMVLLVAHPSVLAMKVVQANSSWDRHPERGHFEFANESMDLMSDFLENILGQPVINETETTQKYSGSLQWISRTDKAADLKEIENALEDQFGLQLVPRREPIEMLVVEKAP